MKLRNPFLTRGYAGAEYFCDREKETRKLLAAVENNRDVTLIAPRRQGKTGLIRHTFSQLPDDMVGIYIDIFHTRSLADFSAAFASAVIGALDTKADAVLSAVGKFFKSCRPTITAEENGMPKISFDVVSSNAAATLEESFAYLQSKNRRAVIAIDEFQQIAEYPEPGVEALLRGRIQFLPEVRFVFAGSRKHIMEEMFTSPARPFYQSTQILSLDVIPMEKYSEFARMFFSKASLPFAKELFEQIYRRFDGITWYVQAVMNRIWEFGKGLSEPGQVEETIDILVGDQDLVYADLLKSQNERSQKVLLAIARNGVMKKPTAGSFLSESKIKSASSVAFALNDLKNRDLIYETPEGWVVYDRLFGIWLKQSAQMK